MLALTMGDPAGIGGELTLKAWRALRQEGPAFAALDDPSRLRLIDPQSDRHRRDGPGHPAVNEQPAQRHQERL